jgi:hypothetical protein
MESVTIAINSDKREFSSLAIFFNLIFHTKDVVNEPGVKVIELTPQSLLEIHGPGSYSSPFLFSESDLVMHLGVENLAEALKTAQSMDFTIIEELDKKMELFSFAYIKIRPGFILGLYQNFKP